MKYYAKIQKYLIILLLTMCTTLATAQFTRQQAIDKVLNEIVVDDTANINVYSAYELKNYQDSVNLVFDTTLLCPYNYNWVFFVDDYPMAGWTHPCRYIFMDSLTGDYQIINENQFPETFKQSDVNEFELVTQVYMYPAAVLPPNPNQTNSKTTANENLYAVLIVTEDTEEGTPGNYIPNRFWYDVSVVYNTLTQEYGYSDENIYIHYYDGESHSDQNHKTDLNDPIDQENHIDFPATKELILETFNNLAGTSTSNPNINPLGKDDQLFVFIDGHGIETPTGKSAICIAVEGQRYDYLEDDDLADAVEEINCAQMIFLIQPCHSGNFAYELTDYNSYDVACENRIVHTSTSLELSSVSERYITNRYYTEFTYYWTAAVRGHYPMKEEPWVESEFATGSYLFYPPYFPFTDHDDDYNPDLNNDGFVQIEEAFLYADDMDAWSPNGYHHPDNYCWECYEEPENENMMGWDYDYLSTLYGLAGTVEDYNELLSNKNYLIGNTLTVNGEFDVNDNANITISGEDARIIVSSSGLFNIYDNVTISGNEIIVDGDIEIGEYVTFNNMGLYLNNHSLQTTFNNSVFNNSLLHNYGEGLTINNSNFNNCNMVYSHRGNVTVANATTFNNTGLYLESIYEQEDYLATVTGCTFSTDMTMSAIDLLNYDRFFINYNTIDGYYNGIQLFNSGEGASGNQGILDNEIMNCTSAGILAYNSIASIADNNIHNNYYGVNFSNYCNINMSGNPSATSYAESQQITNNDSYEVFTSKQSFPWYFRHNVIIDEDNMGGQEDALIYHIWWGDQVPIFVKYNCWGNEFDPDEDFYPDIFYEVPIWCPSGGSIVKEAAETLYLSGREQYDSTDYAAAKNTFEMVISQYPETEYASASMKDLFTIEKFVTNDYSTLQQYYNINAVIQADTILTKLSVFLANKCDVEMEDWQPSINHYEDIINNPEKPEDSIFAIIDLGYLYFLMENSGSRTQAIGHLLEHKPNSKEEFSEKRNFLLALLPFKKEADNNNFEFNQSEGNILLQNTPNPFSYVTTIYFQLNEQCEGSIKIINSIGKVMNEVHFSKTAGLHNIELDMSNLPVGIYYYSMVINGNRTDTKKMVVVK